MTLCTGKNNEFTKTTINDVYIVELEKKPMIVAFLQECGEKKNLKNRA